MVIEGRELRYLGYHMIAIVQWAMELVIEWLSASGGNCLVWSGLVWGFAAGSAIPDNDITLLESTSAKDNRQTSMCA